MLSRAVIIILIGVILFCGLYAIRKQPKYNPIKPKNPDDPVFEDCMVVKDGKLNLRKCDSSDACKSCKGNVHNCITVDDENPLKYRHSDGKQYDIPNGKWCIPEIQQSETCNRFTGAYILAKAGDSYAWVCECTNPKLFDKESYWSDCTEEVACLSQIGGGELVCPPHNSACKEGTPWLTGKNWDPAIGVCKCDKSKGYIASDDGKFCVRDGCGDGGEDQGDGTCKCPVGELSCPGDIPADSWYAPQCNRTHPICVTDPCGPGGRFDPDAGVCICDEANGYYDDIDPQSIVGHKCVKLCTSTNNPCGDRGECKVDIACIRKVQAGESTGIPSKCVAGSGLNVCMQCDNCRNCTGGYKQGECNQCNVQCTRDNGDCSDDSDCCSNRCHYNIYPPSKYCHKCKGY